MLFQGCLPDEFVSATSTGYPSHLDDRTGAELMRSQHDGRSAQCQTSWQRRQTHRRAGFRSAGMWICRDWSAPIVMRSKSLWRGGREPRAGDAQDYRFPALQPRLLKGLQEVTGGDGAPVVGQLLPALGACLGQIRRLGWNQDVVGAQWVVLYPSVPAGPGIGVRRCKPRPSPSDSCARR